MLESPKKEKPKFQGKNWEGLDWVRGKQNRLVLAYDDEESDTGTLEFFDYPESENNSQCDNEWN